MENIRSSIVEGVEKLESITDVKWPSNKRITRDKLIDSFSQVDISPSEYLGYKDTTGLYRVMTRSVPKIKEYKKRNQEYRNFLLELVDKFMCYECESVLGLEDRVKNGTKIKNLCKPCDNIKSSNKMQEGRQYLYNYLLEHQCVDCGNNNPIVLEFDHINPATKLYNVSDMKGSTIEKINLEISKCEVVCSNCHKIRTAKMQNWYKDLK